MERRILTLKLTPEQTSELKEYFDLKDKGEFAIFQVAKTIYDPEDKCITANLEIACLPWSEAVKVANMIRKLFGQQPIQHRAKRAKPTTVDD